MKFSTKSNLFYLQILSMLLFWNLFPNISLTSQITIKETVLTENINNVYREILYETNTDISPQLADIINAIGSDQTWDFSNLNYIDSTETYEQILTVQPDDPNLNNPNLAGSSFIWMLTIPPVTGGLDDTTFQYQYGNLQNGNWTVNGSITIADIDSDGMVDTFLQWFSPSTLVQTFPVTSTSMWYDSTSLMQNFMGMTFTSAIMIDSNWVEGYGTLMTPQGNAEVLRIKQKSINMIPGSPFVDIGNSLDFLSADVSLRGSIVIEDGRAFYGVRTLVSGTPPTATVDLSKVSFDLKQNFPNPFSGSTTIAFDLEKAEKVTIQVLDLNGRTVEVLLDQSFSKGDHQYLWETKNLSSGIYLLEMRVGGQIQHRRMMVLD